MAGPRISKQDAISELWRRGNLRWKLHSVQKEMYDLFYNSKPNSVLVWLLARQSGKSYLLAIIALEYALRQKNVIVKLITDTKLHLQSIFEPIFKELLVDCPEDILPNYNSTKYAYHFSNGSQIQLAGSDNQHYERLRGQKSHLVLIDEAGFCSDLDTMIKSVLLPTTTHTGGKIVLATTPPLDPNHPFISFLEAAKLHNQLVTKTIDDNPLLNADQRRNLEEQMGGRNSENFRREYLCEMIREEKSVVIPEFTQELQSHIVREWPKPPFLDSYVSMDLGFKDLTVVLFGYYDFRNAKIIIEDEIVADFQLPDMNLEKLTQLIIKKEEALYLNIYTNELKKPAARVSDINYIVTNEILNYSRKMGKELTFLPAKKDDAEAAINNLKVLVSSKKIIIDPKCVTLIRHLENAKWKPGQKTTFARSPDNGHYDAVDALKYLIRHVQTSKNPYPAHYELNMRDVFVNNQEGFKKGSNSREQLEHYRAIFKSAQKRIR